MLKRLTVALPIALLGCHSSPPPGALHRPVVPRVEEADRPGTLRIRVVSPLGAPLAGADVIATSPGHPQRSARTDETGMVVFWSLHPGIWRVSASLAGYEPQAVASVSVSAEGVTPTLVTLQPSVSSPTGQPLLTPLPDTPTASFTPMPKGAA